MTASARKHADLWDKVDEAYFNLPDDYDFDNYDEAAFIRSLSFLTDAEKDELIADYNRLVELDNQLCKLYDTIWGKHRLRKRHLPPLTERRFLIV